MILRLDQAAAIREASRRNIILRGDTGVGKTLVAVLLIKEIASEPVPASQAKKIIVFLAPVVALVNQQASAIREETNLKVQELYGAMGVDFWKREQYIEALSTDVLVLTPAIFLNILDHGYWELCNVSLIVFDEAHHAAKKHPYALIMQSSHYFALEREARPRILGLTASPIFNAKTTAKTLKSIEEIESNLNSTIYELSTVADEDAPIHTAAKEVLKTYNSSPISLYPIFAAPNRFEEILTSLTLTIPEIITFSSESWDELEILKQEIGEAGSDEFIYQLLKEKANPKIKTFNDAAAPLRELLVEPLRELEIILASRTYTPSNLSPKTLLLFEILESHLGSEEPIQSIIFTQRRSHAQILSELITRRFRNDFVGDELAFRAGWLVGHASGRSVDDNERAKMAIKVQERTVSEFRTGQLNLLVATQVAEEGLDFRRCTTVIRFNEIQTITSYIQSRGRARAKNAVYYVIAEAGSRGEALYLNYKVEEKKLHTLYANRPIEEKEPERNDLSIFIVESTGALLNFDNAIPLISELCSLLRDDEFDSNRPNFDIQQSSQFLFQATLTIPEFGCMSGKRRFIGDRFSTKRLAKKSASFNCLKEIYAAGGLDEWLLPVVAKRTIGAARDADDNLISMDLGESLIETKFRNLAGNFRSGAFLHQLEILESNGTITTIGLICGIAKGFDSLELFEDGESLKIAMKKVTAISLDEKMTSSLENMNRTISNVIQNRKLKEVEFYYLWVPLASAGDIDWELVNDFFSPIVDATPGSIVVIPGSSKNRFFELLAKREDVNTQSSSFEIVRNSKESSLKRQLQFPVFADYYYMKYGVDIQNDPPGDIISLKKIPIRIENLLRPTEKGKDDSEPVEIIENHPASNIKSSLPFLFFKNIMRSPSIIRLIHDTEIAKSFVSFFNLDIDLSTMGNPINKIIKSLTPTCALTGFDFQSLETLGDSFLKLATTIYISTKFSKLDEGQMAILRSNSVDNRYLSQKGRAIGHWIASVFTI